MSSKSFTLDEINQLLNGSIVGFTNHHIVAPQQLEYANVDEITFIGNKKYENLWKASKASIAIVNQDINIEP